MSTTPSARIDPEQRVVFLDVDGVLVSGRCYLRARDARGRPGFDPVGAAMIRRLCEHCAPCAIVWNTSWNAMVEREDRRSNELDAMARRYRLDAHGASAGPGLHAIDHTGYPLTTDRLRAINAWLARHAHPHTRWTALDDAAIDHPNAVRITPDDGIRMAHYRAACTILGVPDNPIIAF